MNELDELIKPASEAVLRIRWALLLQLADIARIGRSL